MIIFNFLALFFKIQPFEAIFRTFRAKNQPNQIFPDPTAEIDQNG